MNNADWLALFSAVMWLSALTLAFEMVVLRSFLRLSWPARLLTVVGLVMMVVAGAHTLVMALRGWAS